MTYDEAPSARPRRGVPGWLFFVVPLVLSAALVGGISIAVRSNSDKGDSTPDLSGPAAELPAVTDAATQLLGTPPPPTAAPPRSARRTATSPSGSARSPIESQFAEQFERLPDAESKLVGRTLGAIQAELTPEGAGGGRKADRAQRRHPVRLGDVPGDGAGDAPGRVAARSGAGGAAVLDPGPRRLRLAGRHVRDRRPGCARRRSVDPALSDAGAAELISSIAFLMGQKIPADGDLGKTFNTAYQAALP